MVKDKYDTHTYTAEGLILSKKVRQTASDLDDLLENIVPSAPKTVAMEKLEECVMWANKAIAMCGVNKGGNKVMLSQPMAGKTEAEIIEARDKAVAALKEKGYRVINTLFTDEWYSDEAMESRGVEQIPLCFLAKSLENMSLCHAVYFCKGWEQARGCRIEHEAAKAYGLEIIYEE